MPAASAPTRKTATNHSASAPDPVPTSRFLSLTRLPELMARVAMSRSAIYSAMAQGRFPLPVTQGRSVAWVNAEIDAYIERRMQARKAS